jgi:hypothetical protein
MLLNHLKAIEKRDEEKRIAEHLKALAKWEREQKVVDSLNDGREPHYRKDSPVMDACGHFNCSFHGLCAYDEFVHLISITELPVILEAAGMEMIDFVEEMAFSLPRDKDASPTF